MTQSPLFFPMSRYAVEFFHGYEKLLSPGVRTCIFHTVDCNMKKRYIATLSLALVYTVYPSYTHNSVRFQVTIVAVTKEGV